MKRFTLLIIALIALASTFFFGSHMTGASLAVVNVLGAAAPNKRKRGGGNLLAFKQIKLNSDGTFGVLTGTDNLGDTAGSWHILGSHEDTGIQGDDKGGNSIEATILEMDAAHRNLVRMVSPITSAATFKDPDLNFEDGTIAVSAEITGTITYGYFEVWYLDAPIGGKAQAFVSVMQFSPVYAYNNKIQEWSKNKFKLSSVDAQGYVCPALPTAAGFSTFSAPTLSVPYQQGKHIEGT